MASPAIEMTNDENAVHTATDTKPVIDHGNSSASPRRVLGAKSPNVRSNLQNRPMAGSPLKRSFTAMTEEGSGLMYLKKRRVSISNQSMAKNNQSINTKPAQQDQVTCMSMPAIEEPMPSPTEPNTPSSDDGDDNSRSSANSFSSLINYNPSSQGTHLLLAPVSRAQRLKLHLRVAMYKVRTNQVNIPFAELHVEGSALPNATSRAVEAAVASLREEARRIDAAMSQENGSKPCPKLLPAPMLKPTAYSSRMIYEPPMRSSPPVGDSSSVDDPSDSDLTPRPTRQQDVSSPESFRRSSKFDELDVTSSVVKGKVAEGLLGLRNAV